jgi:uncharacterized membrane protein YkoI
MFKHIRTTLVALAALAAMALGGSALAGAASNDNSGTQTSTTQSAPAAPQGQPPGRHIGANGQQEQALSSDVSEKVAAAALKKVPGGTLERTETDVDHGSPYEAHIRKSDGTEVEVQVNSDYTVAAVNQMGGPMGQQ